MKLKKKHAQKAIFLFTCMAALGFSSQIIRLLGYVTEADLAFFKTLTLGILLPLGAYKVFSTYHHAHPLEPLKMNIVTPPRKTAQRLANGCSQKSLTASPFEASSDYKLNVIKQCPGKFNP